VPNANTAASRNNTIETTQQNVRIVFTQNSFPRLSLLHARLFVFDSIAVMNADMAIPDVTLASLRRGEVYVFLS
jgi:hypothetical protein